MSLLIGGVHFRRLRIDQFNILLVGFYDHR